MKKSLLLTAAASSLLLFAACSAPATTDAPVTDAPAPEAPVTPGDDASIDTPVVDGSFRSGLGIITTLDSSRAATDDADGRVQADSIVVAVTVDENDIIQDLRIDTAQTRVDFSNEGEIISDLEATIRSKMELGPDYGMSRVSEVGEWNEQIEGLKAWAIGRSVSEFTGMPLDGDRAADADLMATTTVSVDGYLEAFNRAIENLSAHTVDGGSRIGLGIETAIDGSTPATADNDGRLEVSSYIVMLALNSDDVITAATIDRAESRVGIDATGAITTDIDTPVPTSAERREDYNMLRVSGIEKELYEQYAGFAEWMIGRTPAEVMALPLDGGRATDDDVAATVTVTINEFLAAVQKAANNAR